MENEVQRISSQKKFLVIYIYISQASGNCTEILSVVGADICPSETV